MNDNIKQGIEKSYLLFCHPRSGSNLLASLLASIECGNPQEFWQTDEVNYEDILRRGTAGGIWGGWIHWGALGRLINMVKTVNQKSLSFTDGLYELFPNLNFIYLSRRNKLRQAISWTKLADKGKPYHIKAPQKETSFEVDKIKLDQKIKQLWKEEHDFEMFFEVHAISVCRIFYENLIEKEARQNTVQYILNFLNVSYSAPLKLKTPYYKIGGEETERIYMECLANHRNSELFTVSADKRSESNHLE